MGEEAQIQEAGDARLVEETEVERRARWAELDAELDLLPPRERYERSFWHFCLEVKGLPHLYEPLHRPVCEFIQGIEDDDRPYTCLLLPRGHFKTTLASECYTEWRLCCDPDLRVLICHGKYRKALAILRNIKTAFETNENIHRIWPEIIPPDFEAKGVVWTKEEICLRRNIVDRVPSVTAGATEATNVGSHYDLLIHDDLVYKENVGTEEQRQKTKDYRSESEGMWQSEDAKTLNVGTRWHWDDAHQELVDGAKGIGGYADQVRALVMGCYHPTGEPIFPKVEAKIGKKVRRKGFTREELERKRIRNGNFVFSCNYLNDPQRDETKRFKREDFKWFDLTPDGKLPTKRAVSFFTAVDPNRDERRQGDPAVVLTAGVDAEGEMWVVDMSRGHPSGPQLVLWIREHVKRWKPQRVLVEVQFYQLQLVRWLKEDMLKSRTVYRIQTLERSRKSTKHERIFAMEPFVAAGGLNVRRGMVELVNELEHFPDWKNDDIADALADLYAHGVKARPEKVAPDVSKNPFTVERVLEDLFLEESRTRNRGRVRRVPAWHQ